MISLELFGDPVPLARPRFFSKGKFTGTYDSQTKLKEGVKWQLKTQFREVLLTTPLTVDLIFFMPIPKSTSGIKKRQMANGLISHMKKPDLDNLIKYVLDCMVGTIIEDDNIIEKIIATKKYSNNPGTLIRIDAQTKTGVLHEDNRLQNKQRSFY